MASNRVPKHWKRNSWEEKARENPLYAVMTTPEMADAAAADFSPEHIRLFLDKGRRLAERLVLPALAETTGDGLVVEYGCGAGRILNALVERGVRCAGIDISQTMLDHCRRLVPGVESLTCLDKKGGVPLPDGCASLVFSYAVVQHIDRLSAFEMAVGEMCRLLDERGRLVLQVNCEDFTLTRDGELGRTENFEDHSIHYPPGAAEGCVHTNTTWSGVYIGLAQLETMLTRGGVRCVDVVPYNDTKPRAVVVFGVKGAA